MMSYESGPGIGVHCPDPECDKKSILTPKAVTLRICLEPIIYSERFICPHCWEAQEKLIDEAFSEVLQLAGAKIQIYRMGEDQLELLKFSHQLADDQFLHNLSGQPE